MNKQQTSKEIVIIGGGIVGLTLARQLISSGIQKVQVIEKEPEVALHASGRNSGVLHAGVYYPAETLKAKLCLQGNKALQEYCQLKGLYLNKVGKVIVARDASELPMLMELERRSKANGADVEIINEQQLSEIEPHAKTTEKALYSKDTAIVNPKEIMHTLLKELKENKHFEILLNSQFLKPAGKNTIETSQGKVHFDLLINAGGSYADQIAHHYDVGLQYSFLPFKGIYKKLRPDLAHLIRGNIYPVPDVRNPFLGVHFTRNASGDVYIGPTAIPAFGRENYGIFSGIGLESAQIIYKNLVLLLKNPKVRNVATTEPLKYMKKYFYKDARKLVKSFEMDWMLPTTKVGLRPQLVNWKTKELEMDFVVEKNENTLHILNAISPAFTSSMAFSDYIIKNYIN